MATQTVFLNGNETYVGNPPDDNFIITDNGVGSNTITLGNGTDQLTLGSGGNNTVSVGDGADQIAVGGASNTVTTGNGDSQISTVGGNNTITVGTGSNTITLGDAVSGSPDTVSTGAGNNVVSVSADAVSGDTIMGALTSGDGFTNQLVLTTAGTMSPVNVSGFQSYQLANGGLNGLTLSDANFARLPGGSITVIGGNSGNTINASSLSAADSIVVDAGAGIDALTGGAGNDRFVFAASNLSGDTVDGGTGNNTLELMAGGAGILTGLGTNFVNLGTVVLDANATWMIGISNPAAFTGIVSGFVPGDTFDLPNVPFDSSGAATLGSGNVLQVAENGGSVTIALDPNQSFARASFQLSNDLAGGTLVNETIGQPAPRDFDGNGTSDILWRQSDGNVATWEMNGTTIAAKGLVGFADPSSWHISGTGDFNGDGKSDILWQDNGGDVAIWEMNGTSLAASALVGFADPASWAIRGTGDFNGDGTSDILWQKSDGNVAIWEMNGGTVAASGLAGFADPTSWHIRGTGDFNGDGKSDILWQDNNGDVDIWQMNGTTVAASATVGLAAPPNSHIVGTGDFNGDGKSDILWQDSSGNVAIWEMNGTSVIASGNVAFTPPTSWQIVGIGDYNGDGKSDILWQNNGNVAVWEMNATSIAASGLVGFADPASWAVVPPDNTGDITAASGASFRFGDISSGATAPTGGAAASPAPASAVPSGSLLTAASGVTSLAAVPAAPHMSLYG